MEITREHIIANVTSLDYELIAHYKISNSTLGWLMMLNIEELEQIYDSIMNRAVWFTLPVIAFIEDIPKDEVIHLIPGMWYKHMERFTRQVITVIFIKRGDIKVNTVSDTDSKWSFDGSAATLTKMKNLA